MKKTYDEYDVFEGEEYELSDEELDELYRPKKQNNRKHSLPLFVYLILKEKSSFKKKMSQSQIINELFEKYELEIERKALARTIHDIEDENIGIHSHRKGGAWYEQNESYY